MKAVKRSLRTGREKAEEDKVEESTELKLTVNKKRRGQVQIDGRERTRGCPEISSTVTESLAATGSERGEVSGDEDEDDDDAHCHSHRNRVSAEVVRERE